MTSKQHMKLYNVLGSITTKTFNAIFFLHKNYLPLQHPNIRGTPAVHKCSSGTLELEPGDPGFTAALIKDTAQQTAVASPGTRPGKCLLQRIAQ